MMEEKTESGQPANALNETADKIIADVKKFHTLSLVGLGLVALFFIFMFVDAFNYRWLVMLPIAGAAGFILYRQDSEIQGFEKKVCYYGLIVLAALFVFRDIGMASKHFDSYKAGAANSAQFKALAAQNKAQDARLIEIMEMVKSLKANKK